MANPPVKHLTCMPQVLLKALETCNSESVDRRQLAVVCRIDPVLSIAVLKAAGATRPPAAGSVSVDAAVNRLGVASVRQLVLNLLVRQCLMSGKRLSWTHQLPIWRHSVKCALMARRLARSSALVPAEEAYLAGLVHDIGKLVLDRPVPTASFATGTASRTEDGRSGQKERSAPGRRHPGIGALIVEQATGNTMLADAVRYHHETVRRIKGAFGLVKVVYTANILSHHEGAEPGSDGLLAEDLCGVEKGALQQLMNRTGEDLDSTMRFLGMKPPAVGERIFVQTADGQRSLRRCYTEIRDTSLLSASLQRLMHTPPNTEAVLGVLADGLKINFGIRKLMFFILNSTGEKLLLRITRECLRKPSGLTVSTRGPARGIVLRCFTEGRIADSLGVYDEYRATIADEQILHLLGSEGLCCVPLKEAGRCLGVVVMGTDRGGVKSLHAQAGLLKQLTIAATHCLQESRRKKNRHQKKTGDELALLPRRMVHEVNNPLGIIKNYIRLLSLKLPEDHSGRDELKLIIEEVDRISQILSRFASLSKPGIEKKQPIDLNRRLEAFLKIMEKSLLQPKKIVLHTEFDRNLPPFATDWNALKQVIINLVKNAAEAMPRGGWLFIRTCHVPARSTPGEGRATLPGSVEISVKDTGPGIDPDLKARLFKPYVTTKGSDHSGLGLYVVQSIVTLLGGRLHLDSRSGEGTVFKMTFPL